MTRPFSPRSARWAAPRGAGRGARGRLHARGELRAVELLAHLHLVLVMEAGQVRAVEAIDPTARGRVHRLGRWGGFDVPDPYRKGRAAFERALSLIDRGVEDLVKAFWKEIA